MKMSDYEAGKTGAQKWPCGVSFRWKAAQASSRPRLPPREMGFPVMPPGAFTRRIVWYSSANRDESVFDKPFSFDITRSPNDHLAFGFGSHYCLGANLARLEMRVVFEELIARGVEVDRRGNVDYMLSSFSNSLKRMPVSMRATR